MMGVVILAAVATGGFRFLSWFVRRQRRNLAFSLGPTSRHPVLRPAYTLVVSRLGGDVLIRQRMPNGRFNRAMLILSDDEAEDLILAITQELTDSNGSNNQEAIDV